MKRKDIHNRKDIEKLVDRFYAKVKTDPHLGHIFNDVAMVDWEKHLPRMYDFWENIILQTGQYTGNPMTAHFRVHALQAFTKADFQRWLQLFNETLEDHFEGAHTEIARQRAISIATIMEIKLLEQGKDSFGP